MKFIKNAIFMVILVVLLWGCSFIFTPALSGDIDNMTERNRSLAEIKLEPVNSIDVLILGNSESYTSISPMELWSENGVAAFSCGQTGQRVQEAYFTLKQVLKTQHPKLVIIETQMLFSHQGHIKEIENTVFDTASYYFPVFRYHNTWMDDINITPAGNKEYYKGYSFRSTVDPYTGKDYMIESKEQKPMEKINMVFADQILNLCEKNDIQVLLYSAPSPKNYTYEIHNALQAYADSRYCTYLDLNLKTEEIGIAWSTDTLDKGDHLNTSGAQKASFFLAQYLKNHYTLPDHRNDKKYEAWNTLLKAYEEELARQ